jgi:hypothetical protein
VLRFWAAGLLVPVVAYALLGWFSRYASDDYCTAGITLTRGFLDAQVYWYLNWSGRFTFTAVVSALELLGSQVVQVLPALAIALWLAVTTWALLPVARQRGWRSPRLACFVIAEVVVFGTLASAPNIGQSFYMQAGLATYTLPLILVTIYAGWVERKVLAADRRGLSVWMMAVSGVAMLLIGGLSETTASVYAASLGLVGLYALVRMRGDRRLMLVCLMAAGLAGTVLATVLMGAAPGTALRLAQEDDPGFSLSRVPLATGASINLAISIARRFEALSRPTFLFEFGVMAALGWLSTGSRAFAPGRRWIQAVLGNGLVVVLVYAIGLGLLALSLFPSYLIQGYDPPARIQHITDFVLIVALAGTGYIVGDTLGRLSNDVRLRSTARLGLGIALVLLALVPVRESLYIFGQVPVEAAFAADWDRNDRLFRDARPDASGVVLAAPLPPRWNWAFIDETPTDFPNACVARFYGLPAVAATGPAPMWTGATEPGGRSPGLNVGR